MHIMPGTWMGYLRGCLGKLIYFKEPMLAFKSQKDTSIILPALYLLENNLIKRIKILFSAYNKKIKKKCYLCGKKFNDTDTQEHEEHIIQQALGGTITANDILCKNCGNRLSKEIDVDFIKPFNYFVLLLNIKRDRKSIKNILLNGTIIYNSKEIEVVYKDGKVYPKKPFYEEKDGKIIIYANKETAKNYKKKVTEDFKKANKCLEAKNILICDDMTAIVKYPFPLDNNTFKKGLAKIAIGYASKCGISREDLKDVLDTKNNKIKEELMVAPFIPQTHIDEIIETNKDIFIYPFHNLILHTISCENKKILVCYIELFATFQHYIILNDDYKGEHIHKVFAQKILKENDYEINIDWRRYYKERDLYLHQLGITEDMIDKKYKKRLDKNKKRYDIEEEIIKEEAIKQKYSFNFEGYLKNVLNFVSNQIRLNYEYMNDINYAFDLYSNFMLLWKNNEEINANVYRIFYKKEGKHKSYLLEIINSLQKNNKWKEYGHKKFYMLHNFANKRNLEEKFKNLHQA